MLKIYHLTGLKFRIRSCHQRAKALKSSFVVVCVPIKSMRSLSTGERRRRRREGATTWSCGRGVREESEGDAD